MTDTTPRNRNRDTRSADADNDEQRDDDKQAQTIAEDALAIRNHDGLSGESRKPAEAADALRPGDAPDLVDHMNQMVTSGRIDMDAYRGERSDDDEEGDLGDGGIDSDEPRSDE